MSESLGGQFEAWVRQGAVDLHNAIVPAFPESQHGVDQIGTPLAPTSQMVTRDVEPMASSMEAPSVEAAEYSTEPDRSYEAILAQAAGQSREQEMEMERE